MLAQKPCTGQMRVGSRTRGLTPQLRRQQVLPPPQATKAVGTKQVGTKKVGTIKAKEGTKSTMSSSDKPGFSFPNPFAALFSGGNKEEQREEKKQELLSIIKPLARGVNASEEDKEEVEAAARALEKLNPTSKTLQSDLINGKWELLYTTSETILGKDKLPFFRPFGTIYQTLDAPNGKGRNSETFPFFNQVAADLTPMNANRVAVQFTQFKILGLIPVTAPESAKGELAFTYLDDELRVSRGDKGNLFVLRMADPKAKP